MTVAELIKALQLLPANATVYAPVVDPEEGSGFTEITLVGVYPLKRCHYMTFVISEPDDSSAAGVVIR